MWAVLIQPYYYEYLYSTCFPIVFIYVGIILYLHTYIVIVKRYINIDDVYHRHNHHNVATNSVCDQSLTHSSSLAFPICVCTIMRLFVLALSVYVQYVCSCRVTCDMTGGSIDTVHTIQHDVNNVWGGWALIQEATAHIKWKMKLFNHIYILIPLCVYSSQTAIFLPSSPACLINSCGCHKPTKYISSIFIFWSLCQTVVYCMINRLLVG